MALISVILAVYNEESTLQESIQSVLSQELPEGYNLELVVVDDGSTDRTQQVLSDLASTDKRIHVHTQENRGLTKSLNTALELIKGEYVARQDGDDISLPTRLAKQSMFLHEHPEVVLVGCDFDIVDDDLDYITTIRNSQRSDLTALLRRSNPFAHGSIMFRRFVAGQPVLYNTFYVKAQDYDLVTRLAEMGKIAIIPEILYQWRFSSTGISASNVNFYGKRARENYLRRINGKVENYTQPEPAEVSPRASGSLYYISLGKKYLAGYNMGKARQASFNALAVGPGTLAEVLGAIKIMIVSWLPVKIWRFIRE